MDNLTITRATDKHATELADLLTKAIKIKHKNNDNSWGDKPFTIIETLEYIKSGEVYLFYIDNNLSGTVSLTWKDSSGYWEDTSSQAGYIYRLATAIGNKGLGANILKWSENKIKENDKQLARPDCHDSNNKLCSYYLNKGYRKVSTIGDSIKIALLEKNL